MRGGWSGSETGRADPASRAGNEWIVLDTLRCFHSGEVAPTASQTSSRAVVGYCSSLNRIGHVWDLLGQNQRRDSLGRVVVESIGLV